MGRTHEGMMNPEGMKRAVGISLVSFVVILFLRADLIPPSNSGRDS